MWSLLSHIAPVSRKTACTEPPENSPAGDDANGMSCAVSLDPVVRPQIGKGLSEPVPVPSTGRVTVDSKRPGLMAQSAVRLEILTEQLARRKALFQSPHLTFHQDPKSSADPAPRLTYTGRQRSSNMEFLAYQDWLEKLNLEVDTLEVYGDGELKSRRKSLISLLQKEQAYLDGIVEEQWLRKKLELSLLTSASQNKPFVFRTGAWAVQESLLIF